MKRTRQKSSKARYRSDRYYIQLYGKEAIVIRLGQVTIVHLDYPSKKEIKRRTEEVMREEVSGKAFFDDYPLCRDFQKHPYDIVYYEHA